MSTRVSWKCNRSERLSVIHSSSSYSRTPTPQAAPLPLSVAQKPSHAQLPTLECPWARAPVRALAVAMVRLWACGIDSDATGWSQNVGSQ
jgi:hypothetical protein